MFCTVLPVSVRRGTKSQVLAVPKERSLPRPTTVGLSRGCAMTSKQKPERIFLWPALTTWRRAHALRSCSVMCTVAMPRLHSSSTLSYVPRSLGCALILLLRTESPDATSRSAESARSGGVSKARRGPKPARWRPAESGRRRCCGAEAPAAERGGLRARRSSEALASALRVTSDEMSAQSAKREQCACEGNQSKWSLSNRSGACPRGHAIHPTLGSPRHTHTHSIFLQFGPCNAISSFVPSIVLASLC